MFGSKQEGNEQDEEQLQSRPSMSEPPSWTKFLSSGLGGALGWLPVHPFDVAKVRMQIDERATTASTAGAGSHKPNIVSTLRDIVRNESALGLYSGLSAAITRQLTYTTLRLGLYDVFRENIINYRNSLIADSDNNSDNNSLINGNENITVFDKLFCGLSAGAIAAAICNPVEVALVRMQADNAQKDISLKRNYKHVFDAWIRVTREEGFKTLYRGVRPTVARGMIVSCVQLASYDQAKTMIKNVSEMKEGPMLHFSASLISGYLYCLASLPLDICKTRMQNQHKSLHGELMYKSIPQTMYKIVSNEGVFALWKGFTPYFARGGGHTIGMFLCVEQIKKIVKNHYQ